MWTVMGSALHYGIRHGKLPALLLEGVRVPNETQVAVKKKEIPFLGDIPVLGFVTPWNYRTLFEN